MVPVGAFGYGFTEIAPLTTRVAFNLVLHVYASTLVLSCSLATPYSCLTLAVLGLSSTDL